MWTMNIQVSCPSPTPEVHSDSCPSSHWCHPAISSSVVPFSSCPQSLPASGFFPMSQLFTWGGQSTGVSALASFLPKKSQISFRMDWLDVLAVQGTPKSLLQHHSSKASILQCSVFFTVQLSHPYGMTTKTCLSEPGQFTRAHYESFSIRDIWGISRVTSSTNTFLTLLILLLQNYLLPSPISKEKQFPFSCSAQQHPVLEAEICKMS